VAGDLLERSAPLADDAYGLALLAALDS
jgi:hypothetical protein